MLSELARTPFLLFGFDDIKDTKEGTDGKVTTKGQISRENAKVSEMEIINRYIDSSIEELSDIYKKGCRVPIPINDRLLPIHYTGGTTSQSHGVQYMKDSAVLSKYGNNVVLRFEIKNSLSEISTISNILFGLSAKNFFASANARVSFFSLNLCIFNARILGINRTVVDDTDLEVVAITLEIAANEDDLEVKKSTKSSNTDLNNDSNKKA